MSARKLRLRRKRRDKAHALTRTIVMAGGVLATMVCVVALCLVIVANSWLSSLPSYDTIDSYAETGVTTIYASDRETVLAKMYLQNRIAVETEDISTYVIDGTVATEDERFYEHSGIDAAGIMRALVVNIVSDDTEGASTITQQLVRNTILLDEMTDISYKRKIREMYLALKVEETYSKEEILNMYLNVINYGDGCYGIEMAAQNYFGKSASELTLSEAAMLVGIPQSPTANNPRNDYDKADERRRLVLRRMLSNGYITQDEYDAAIDDEPELAEEGSATESTISELAPYFVDYVTGLLDDYAILSESQIARGGLTIYTTLDVDCQQAAVTAVTEGLEDYDSDMDGSLVTVDPSTGDILAMVGGTDYSENQFNLATQMSRQAGSSFKTFALLMALDEGLDPDNTFINSSSPAQVTSTWTVSNSEGSGSGAMSLTAATTKSVNTVYARLVHAMGAEKLVAMAQACGITSDLEAYDSLALGAQGVNVLEMASAYATIAAGGVYHETVAIAEIVNSKGQTIYTHQYTEGTRVVSRQVANKATEILETVIDSGTGTRASLDEIGQDAAGKTGTSQNGRDLWFCGFTPVYSTAVWVGYRQEQATSLYGGTVCAPIWREYMLEILDGEPTVEFDIEDTDIDYLDSDTWDFSDDD